jgi:hypothetical protein
MDSGYWLLASGSPILPWPHCGPSFREGGTRNLLNTEELPETNSLQQLAKKH